MHWLRGPTVVLALGIAALAGCSYPEFTPVESGARPVVPKTEKRPDAYVVRRGDTL